MLYKRHQVRQMNDRKVLHKVGGRWTVVSLSLLMAIGGIALSGRAAHAAVTLAPEQSTGQRAVVIPANQRPLIATRTSSATSSDAASASLEAQINSLETPASVERDVASAASHQPSSSAPASVSVSYLSGPNGSAVSYHAKTSLDRAAYSSASARAQNNRGSLNARYGSTMNSLKNVYSSEENQFNATHSIANRYFSIVNQSNYSQEIRSLATKSGVNPSDYVQSIRYQMSNYSNSISQASALSSELAVVNSDAQLIKAVQSNRGLQVSYEVDFDSAKASLSVNQVMHHAASAVVSDLMRDSSLAGSAYVSNQIAQASDSAAYEIANINSATDSTTVSSLAKSLGWNDNTFIVNSLTDSYAHSLNSAGRSSATFLLYSNSANSSIPIGFASGSNAMLLSDTIARVGYSGNLAKYRQAINSASNAQSSLSMAITSAKATNKTNSSADSSAESIVNMYAILSDPHANLTNLFSRAGGQTVIDRATDELLSNPQVEAMLRLITNQPNLPTSLTSLNASSVLTNFFLKIAQSPQKSRLITSLSDLKTDLNNPDAPSMLQYLMKAAARKIISVANDNIQNAYGLVDNLFGPSMTKSTPIQKVAKLALEFSSNQTLPNPSLSAQDITNIGMILNRFSDSNGDAQTIVKGLLALLNGVNFLLTNGSALNGGASSAVSGLLDPKSYAAASAAVMAFDTNPDPSKMSANLSGISSVASSAASAYRGQIAASSAFDRSSNVTFALAGSLLGSYDNVANSESKSASAAKAAVDNFYSVHGESYMTASNAAQSASAAVSEDQKLAQAYGIYVYNRAPKYIRVLKSLHLHTDPHYSSNNAGSIITRGTTLQVRGVGFDVNGLIRYAVDYQGQEGYITANPTYVQNVYLFSTPYNSVTVKLTKQAWEHSNPLFNDQNRLTIIQPGQVLKGSVVSIDGAYGGFTRIRLENGNYVTSNTLYVNVQPVNNVVPNNKRSQPTYNLPKVSF